MDSNIKSYVTNRGVIVAIIVIMGLLLVGFSVGRLTASNEQSIIYKKIEGSGSYTFKQVERIVSEHYSDGVTFGWYEALKRCDGRPVGFHMSWHFTRDLPHGESPLDSTEWLELP